MITRKYAMCIAEVGYHEGEAILLPVENINAYVELLTSKYTGSKCSIDEQGWLTVTVDEQGHVECIWVSRWDEEEMPDVEPDNYEDDEEL